MFVDMEFVYCLFFFFKKKTAYEMRISDWSSDVCSSDLRVRAVTVAPDAIVDALTDNVAVLLLTQVHYKSGRVRDMAAITKAAHDAGALEIGRAAWRERVCQ